MRGVQIGKVASETGVSIDTIRFYERSGLLRAPCPWLLNRRKDLRSRTVSLPLCGVIGLVHCQCERRSRFVHAETKAVENSEIGGAVLNSPRVGVESLSIYRI